MIEFDPTKLGEYGIGIVALVVVYLLTSNFFKIWTKSVEAQEKGTEALNRNSEAYSKLSSVFETSHEREMEFQKEARQFHLDTKIILEETHRKVDYLHRRKIEEEGGK